MADAAASFSRLSFRRAVSPSPLRLPSLPPRRLRLSFAVVALHKRNPKRLKYASQRQFTRGDAGMLRVKVEPSDEEFWKLDPVIDLINRGAVGIISTDTVYSIVCDLSNNESIERLRRIKGIGDSKPLSILCRSLRDIDTYTTGFPRGTNQGQANIFRAVKRALPGPVRISASSLCSLHCSMQKGGKLVFEFQMIPYVKQYCKIWMNRLSAQEDEWILDPVIIADIYEPQGLDFIVDGGVRIADPSTVVDMTGSYPTIIRQGKGPKLDWMVTEDTEQEAQPTYASGRRRIP